jgi:hypothetical protein
MPGRGRQKAFVTFTLSVLCCSYTLSTIARALRLLRLSLLSGNLSTMKTNREGPMHGLMAAAAVQHQTARAQQPRGLCRA